MFTSLLRKYYQKSQLRIGCGLNGKTPHDPSIKRRLNNKIIFIRFLLKPHRQDKWDQFLDSIDQADNSSIDAFFTSHLLRIPYQNREFSSTCMNSNLRQVPARNLLKSTPAQMLQPNQPLSTPTQPLCYLSSPISRNR